MHIYKTLNRLLLGFVPRRSCLYAYKARNRLLHGCVPAGSRRIGPHVCESMNYLPRFSARQSKRSNRPCLQAQACCCVLRSVDDGPVRLCPCLANLPVSVHAFRPELTHPITIFIWGNVMNQFNRISFKNPPGKVI